MVFDLVISSSDHYFGNVCPSVSKCFVGLDKLHLFSISPLLMVYILIQTVVPSISVILWLSVLLLGQVAIHAVGNKAPFTDAHVLDDI